MIVITKEFKGDNIDALNSIKQYDSYTSTNIESMVKDAQTNAKTNKTKLLGKIVAFDNTTGNYVMYKFGKKKCDKHKCKVTINTQIDKSTNADSDDEDIDTKTSNRRMSPSDQEKLYKEWCDVNKREPSADEKYNEFGIGKYYYKLVSTKDKTTELLGYVTKH